MRNASIALVLALVSVPPAWGQWNLDGYLGWAAPIEADLEIEHPSADTRISFSPLRFDTRSFRRPLYYGVRVGAMLDSRIGLEAEWIHLKVYSDLDRPTPTSGRRDGHPVEAAAPPRALVQRLSASHGLNMLFGNAVVRIPFGERYPGPAAMNLVARIGAGPTWPHVEADLLGLSADHYEAGGPAMQGAGAVELRLWRGLYGTAEYKYTWTRQRWTVGPASIETVIGTHHLVAGLSYQFGIP